MKRCDAPAQSSWRTATENCAADIRFAIRGLWRSPGVAALAVATLAFGLGIGTAMFSLVYAIVLRPLPFRDSARLIRLYEANRANGQFKQDVSVATFEEWRQSVKSLDRFAIYSKVRSRVVATAIPVSIPTMRVSPDFFEILGARPVLGRTFKSEAEYVTGKSDEVVLSYAAWQRLFAGRPDAVGAVIEFAGAGDVDAFRVVGILPEHFRFDQPVDAWFPYVVRPPVAPVVRSWRFDRALARMRAGTTLEDARPELETVTARLAQEFPTTNGGWSVTVESLHDSLSGNFASVKWLLLAAVALVLLVTYVNVSGLFVSRVVARSRDTAMRIALGASPLRLIRQWFVEAAAMTGSGFLVGMFLAWLCINALRALSPPGIPRLDVVSLNLPAVGAALVSALCAAIAFSLAAVSSVRSVSATRVVDSAFQSATDGRRTAVRAVLIATQCACSAALVMLTVLLGRSLVQLLAVRLGWNEIRVVTMNVSPPVPRDLRRPWHWYVDWSERLTDRFATAPGISAAALTTQIPFSPDSYLSTLARGPQTGANTEQRWSVVEHSVTDSYFDLLEMKLLSGRTFNSDDRFGEAQLTSSQPADHGIAVVTDNLARALWPGQSAIGKALRLPSGDNVSWRQVVGVVENIQFNTVGETPSLHVFIPWSQRPTGRPKLLVKGTSRLESTVVAVRDTVRTVQAGTQIDQIAWLDTLLVRATAQHRFTTAAFTGFAALALLLSTLGIYATLSYLVSVRRREIAIHMALGAPRLTIFRCLFAATLTNAVIGTACGLFVALILGRTFGDVLFDVQPVDATSYVITATCLVVAASIGLFVPARNITRLDPSTTLRSQ